MDRTHNPEFTAMIYVAYKDYNWMMEFTENLLEHCAVSVNGTSDATFENQISFKSALCSRNHDRFYQTFYWIDISGKTAELFAAAAEWESK
jgi:lysyl-tRNA synthetase class 2